MEINDDAAKVTQYGSVNMSMIKSDTSSNGILNGLLTHIIAQYRQAMKYHIAYM